MLPANTLVHVTIYNYDGASALRNNWFGQSTGTVGGVITLNGKTTQGIDPDNASHVFSIPQIGLSVPLDGRSRQRQEPVQQRALQPLVRPHDHHIHVPHARQGSVPLAVLRAVRRRIHRRASAVRCRPSATWTASSRSYERVGGAVNVDGTRHWRNVVVLWLIASVIMLPIVIFVLGPGLPPGNGSVEASGQVTDNTVLLATATPVALGVLVYMALRAVGVSRAHARGRASMDRRFAATRASSSGG